ncbi:response regulator, partial [Bacteroidota bacterium]
LFDRKELRGHFKGMGYEIDLAENGQQAIQMVKKNKYDIIFLDLLLPELDGLQAAAEIRKLGFKLPIIALSSVDDKDSRKEVGEAGMNDYLVKPVAEVILRKFLNKNYIQSV